MNGLQDLPIKRGIDVGHLAARHDRERRVARRARLHRDQHVNLLLKYEAIECLLCAGRARGVVGDFQRQLAAEHAALCVDLLDRELSRLHHGGCDNAVGAGQADRHAYLDRLRGKRGSSEERGAGRGGKQIRERTSGCH